MRLNWLTAARPAQLPPLSNWHSWLLLAGRGFGKTRAGAEEFCWQLLRHDGWRGAIVAPTMADARDTCVEGESGLLEILPPECIANWNRSQSELTLFNGSRIKLFSADAPERLRGPQHHVAWGDEVAAWNSAEALDQLRFGLRLGQNPKLILTTTPKPLDLIRDLLKQEGQGVVVARGHTFENAANLAPAALAELRRRYEGTRMGRQELYADVLDDVAGALWPHELISRARVSTQPALQRVVVAIDPAVTSGAASDNTGIVAAGLGVDEHVYVLADASGKYTPDGWARRALALFAELQADLIIGEVNQGGDLVETILRSVAPHVPYKAVHANRGKVLRAEPVAALYEQQLVHHVGVFEALEREMTRFAPGTLQASPDRVDALVWAVTELKLRNNTPRLRHL
jgi:phage terminase large subunit-like protein